MTRYRLYGGVIESARELPELEPVADGETIWHVDWDARAAEPERWLQHFHLPDGPVWLSSGRTANGYLLRFPNLADFLVTPVAREIRCRPVNGTPAETIRHLLLDHVIPRLLPLRGLVALHAGAVRVPGGAAGFLGEAGQGKSTLVASFGRAGFAVMADDCLALAAAGEDTEALGSYPGIRLWPDVIPSVCATSPRLSPVAHFSDKQRVGPSAELEFFTGPVPLRRLYVLDVGEGDDASVEGFDPPVALLELLKSSYRLGDESREGLLREFGLLTRLVSGRLVRRLRVPQDLDRLRQAHATVIADLGRDT